MDEHQPRGDDPGGGRRRPRRGARALTGMAALLAVCGGLYAACTGPRDLGLYPPQETSPYKLPWPGGVTRLCVQGNRGVVSHRGVEEFAWDFAMPEGSDVLAARGGRVVRVVVSHDGRGFSADNNLVAIDHGDGTIASYLHLRRDGAFVQPGDVVAQGQRIGASGNVGRSLLPHLHFHVRDPSGATMPISFADLARDRGIPRMLRRYRSGNAPR